MLLGEEMPWSEVVSFAVLFPAGTVNDPDDKSGLAGMTCDMTSRGAGQLDNRQFLQTLENLGIDISESASQTYTVFHATMLACQLDRALELVADQIRRPLFAGNELASCRQALLQELAAVEDEPAQKLMLEQERNFLPWPLGRPSFGTAEGLDNISMADIHNYHRQFYQPAGGVIGVAGRFDRERLKEKVELLFNDWEEKKRPDIIEREVGRKLVHIPFDSEQTHIGLACPSIPLGHPDYYLAWSGVKVLSGGMSSRLFTEVREKRGLCYTVYASHCTYKNRGAIYCYCGTRVRQATESLEVILREFRNLSEEGITEEELERIKIQAKSSLIMSQESTKMRAGTIAFDWYFLQRVRGLDELEEIINRLSVSSINRYLSEHPVTGMRLVTLGNEPIPVSEDMLP